MRSLAVAFAVFFFWALPALAAKHAFVVGNAAYESLGDLRNTHADAAAYAEAFGELGYDVRFLTDLTLDETEEQFDRFLDVIAPGDEVVFVYSGHGWSDGGTNYLIPTDAPEQGRDRQLIRASIALRNGVNGVLDEFEAAGVALTVAIIDACRNNPFAASPGTRSTAIKRGLAPVRAATGTFVIFSAGEGQEALDRLPDDPEDQTLSVFTRTFLPHLKSGVALERAISGAQVETAALARTVNGHLQHPAYYDQTLGDTCLAGVCKAAVAQNACDALHAEAREARACFAYEAYAQTCPEHLFAPMAAAFMARNCAAPEETATAPTPAPVSRAETVAAWRQAGDLPVTRARIGTFFEGNAWVDPESRTVGTAEPYEKGKMSEFLLSSLEDLDSVIFDSRNIAGERDRVLWSENVYAVFRPTGALDLHDAKTDRLLSHIPSRGGRELQFRYDYRNRKVTVLWRAESGDTPAVHFDMRTGEILKETRIPHKWHKYPRLGHSSRSDMFFVSDERSLIHVWNLRRNTVTSVDVQEHLGSATLSKVRISEDGTSLFVSPLLNRDRFYQLEIETGALLREQQDKDNAYVWGALRIGDSPVSYLFAGTDNGYAVYRNKDWSKHYETDLPFQKFDGEVSLDRETGLLALLSPTGDLEVHDLWKGEKLMTRTLPESNPLGLGFIDKAQELVLVGESGALTRLRAVETR